MTLGPIALALALSLSPPADVRRAERAASQAYRDAISDALATVDPDGLHPAWRLELWRICWRESKCGAHSRVTVHAGDAWTGRRAYARAVERGRLRPGTCDAHRLDPRTTADFATRGGFGVNAARGVRYLGACVGPEELDAPGAAALVAAKMIAGCEVDGRACVCSDHAALWTGRARFASRPLLSWVRRSRAETVAAQCGRRTAAAYVLAQILMAPLDAWPGT